MKRAKPSYSFFSCSVFFLFLLRQPNVGLDVLRNKRVWSVLRSRARDEHCTVLVFSHNVDDTRHADRVGFLRAGRLLAEGTPQDLCSQYSCRSLDAVFTALCLQDDQSFLPIVRKMDQKSSVNSVGLSADDEDFRHFEAVSESSSSDNDGIGDGHVSVSQPRSSELRPLRPSRDRKQLPNYVERGKQEWRGWKHIPAVLVRHFQSLRRSWLLLLFQIAVPTLLALMFLVFVGHTPMMLNVAVVNQDNGPLGAELATIVNFTDLLETRFFGTYEEARATVTQSDGVLAIFVIPSNFTTSLNELMAHPAQYASKFINVELWLDYGDYEVTNVVEDKLEKSLQILLANHYGTSMRLYDAKAIYGSPETQYGLCEKKEKKNSEKKKKKSSVCCCWLPCLHCILLRHVCDGTHVFLGAATWLLASRFRFWVASLGSCVIAHFGEFYGLHHPVVGHDGGYLILFPPAS